MMIFQVGQKKMAELDIMMKVNQLFILTEFYSIRKQQILLIRLGATMSQPDTQNTRVTYKIPVSVAEF